MKKLATVSLIAIAALALTPRPAAANDEALAAIGGFIGGLIIGANANPTHTTSVYYAPACPPPGPIVIVDGEYGYWQKAPVRVWIAPTWVIVRDRWDRPIRRYVAGHYETRMRRMWVATSRHHDRRSYYRDRDYRRHDRDRDRYDRDRNHHRSDRRDRD